MKTKTMYWVIGIAVAAGAGILIYNHFNKYENKSSAAGRPSKKSGIMSCPDPDNKGYHCQDGEWTKTEKGTCWCSGDLIPIWQIDKTKKR